ncbi:MAG: hypothetical protein IJN56_03225 [Clostridia bacterium]|nr:hypothetical protein [Clostridia bacterium]
MKITINKSAKRALSLVLALAMLVGSLFVANSGVTFTASAATVEDTWDGTKVEPTATDAEGNIIISTAEELAWIALQGGSTTQGKSYKVVDNAVFNLNGMAGITLNSTAANVEAAAKTSTWTFASDGNEPAFGGYFDGNGLIVYNASGKKIGYNGLFPATKPASGGTVTIKNITVVASDFRGYHNAGGIVGLANAPDTSTSLVLENCVVKNCVISDGADGNSACQRTVGTHIGNAGHNKTTVSNCLAVNNKLSGQGINGGFVGNVSGYNAGLTISNSVAIGNSPVPTANTTALSAKYANAVYSNVYTDQTVSQTGVTTLTTAQMTGEAATQNMALDFSGAWFANTSGAPELRMFHNVTAKDNENGTHSELCADCGLVGLTVEHYYNDVNYDSNITSCVCGQFIFGTHDVWDGTKASGFAGGTGTEADPYIIKTVEQLFLMVRSTGINADGTPIYYKVDDNVNALYINDTRAFADQAAFEAAADSLKNWSIGLTTEAELCGDTANCYSEHYNDVYTSSSTKVLNNHRDGYVDYFGGRFDGNGVTIYGLYSMTTAANHWNNGTGFVPMLTGDAVIKNVTFDTNYVKSNSGSAAVITATTGIWDGQYNKDTDSDGTYETFVMCPAVDAYAKRPENCNAAIINVAVRNSYLNATNYSNKSYVAGFVSTIRSPKSLKFDNCLFDGTNTTITDTGTDCHYAFIVSQESNTNATVTSCASVAGSNTVTGLNSYTTAVNSVVSCNELDSNEFTISDAPLLNWTAWEIIDNKPTPKVNNSWIADYYRNQGQYALSWRKNKVLTSTDVYGTAYEFSALRNNRGVFNDYNTLIGSGTEADPYIINDANTLYMVIASGGTHYGVPQYYKLGCNIDLEGKQWVDTDTFENTTYNVVFYEYHPFEGILDGDGHTISNLYSAISSEDSDDEHVNSAGFIPVLKGGTVKNIHFNNVSVSSTKGCAGVVTGWMEGEGTSITGCTADNAYVYSAGGYGDGIYIAYNDDVWTPDEYGYITDSYYVGVTGDNEYKEVYITDHNADDGIILVEPNDVKAEILAGNTEYTSKWYIGASDDAIPRLIENAKKMPCADINGDGIGEEYDTSDVTALKNNLLWKDGYDYIYGDVTGNGKTDMRDLAAVQRIMTGQETTEYDGFWANVKAGKFTIYYTDNDNYDFARKLELYLESKTGAEVEKINNGDSSKYAIKLVTSGDANAWSYTYDVDNAVLTFTGGSFTAVEAAVDHFIQNVTIFDLPEETTGTIDSAKNAITLDGSTYYYAWGDEFNSDVEGTVSYDKWNLRNKSVDDTPGGDPDESAVTIDTEFEYIRKASDDEAREINKIIYDEGTENGKLYLKRGFTGATADKEHKFYMSGIGTKDSMLFKQGYLEMVAAVPSDGYAFPAWWLLTHDVGNGNITLDKSLYSKVYERNGVYNGTSTYATPTDVTTYKYKVPTQTLEMDLFEIIQRPTEAWNWGSWGYVSKPSEDHNIKFNIHKWYSYSLDKNDNSLAVYDLDWANAPTSGAFSTKLLTASGATEGTGYTQQSASIKINTGNLSGGSVNGAATYQGDHDTMQYDMGTLRNSSEQITERKYGFLWNDDEMTFIVYTDATGTTELYRATVTKDQMNFGSESYSNSDTFGFDQYAYMLIENHIFTAQQDGSSWIQAAYDDIGECDLVIDYVRLYQLDGARAIITPESESIYDR